jgi:hypothetical protein
MNAASSIGRQALRRPRLLTLEASSALARKLRRWAPGQVESVRLRLAEALKAWTADWIGGPPPEEITVAVVGAPASPLPGAPLEASWYFDSASRAHPSAALACALFGPAGSQGEIAARTAQAAWDDWLVQLKALHVRLEPHPRSTRQDMPVNPWATALRVSLPWCGEPLRLILPEGVVAALLGEQRSAAAPRNTGAAAPITGLGQALGNERIALRVLLADAELSLGQLASLQIGDVIPLRHRVDRPARILTSDGATLCDGWLGQSGGHLAVELVPLHQQQDIPHITKEHKP